ncbi:hypothetical protein [Rodentibacter caecimuris]|nr:hypothetical protein [Rodentibacter heylii]
MFKRRLTYTLVAVVVLGFINPAIAEKKKKGRNAPPLDGLGFHRL